MLGRAAFALFWLVAACVCTFDPPFQNLGNGYFGAWICTILAIQSLAADKAVQAKLDEASQSSLKEKVHSDTATMPVCGEPSPVSLD